jgi:methylamine dehydrogenase heavy chain
VQRIHVLRPAIAMLLGALILAACEGKKAPPTAEPKAPAAAPAATPAPAGAPREPLQPELLHVAEVPQGTGHRVFVHDFNFDAMIDGRNYLVDADSGRVLGLMSTGYGGAGLVIAPDRHEIYSIETYYSRGSRGERTDVVTIYDPKSLAPTTEIAIPPKRASTMPMLGNWRLTDDARFLLVFNMTPATSVTVVDVAGRKLVGEIETPGCALTFPGPEGRFAMLCGDGTLLDVALDSGGAATRNERTAKFFDPAADLLTEKAVRHGNTWYFISFAGDIYPLEMGKDLVFGQHWALADDTERGAGWRPGGLQLATVHEARGQLFVLMHQGGPDTHKDPGTEIWVFDLATHKRLQRLTLTRPATSIEVSQDEAPLLYTVFMGARGLEVYDATSGKHLRSVPDIGFSPSLVIND